MSNRWEIIRRRKAKVDSSVNAVYTRHSRAIMVAARNGVPDPEANFSLRTAIEKARAAGMPSDNIERAIKRGAGQLGSQDALESFRYEGYGPGGIAVLLEILTDNRNRTAADVREAFSKSGGNLGETGCVSWMFEQKGVVQLQPVTDEEAFLLDVAEAGGDDIATQGEVVEVYCDYTLLESVTTALKQANYEVLEASLRWIPSTVVTVQEPDMAKQVLKLMDRLDALDDVQNVFANFEIDDALLTAIA
jgi:YebC/PmpR family DNA-binding regulatory protein